MPRIGKLVNTLVILGLLSAFCSFQLLFRSTAGQSGPHSRPHSKHAMQASSTSTNGDSSMQHGSMMMMPMYFMATTDTILWFKGLHTHSLVTYLLSLAGLAGFALLHEALAAFRVTLAKASKPVPEGYSPMPEPATGRKVLLRRAGISGLYALNLTTGCECCWAGRNSKHMTCLTGSCCGHSCPRPNRLPARGTCMVCRFLLALGSIGAWTGSRFRACTTLCRSRLLSLTHSMLLCRACRPSDASSDDIQRGLFHCDHFQHGSGPLLVSLGAVACTAHSYRHLL